MSDWIKCSDRLPEDIGDVLVFFSTPNLFCDVPFQDVVTFDNRHGFCSIDESKITHWQPLPEPPED